MARTGNGGSAQPAARGGTDVLAARSMPESLAAEAAILGSMIIDPECISSVVEQLKTDAFYRTEHQMIFDALIALYEKNPSAGTATVCSPEDSARIPNGGALGTSAGEGIDGVLLRDELEKRKQLEAVGGVEYLAKVIESVPSSANVMYYAKIVKDRQLLRELIAATTEILDGAYNKTGEVDEKLDDAERRIFAITDKKISGSAAALKDLVVQVYSLIEAREHKHVTGLATGYYELDGWTCGLQNGEMIIIAGRPSMGKTALALNMAEHIGVVERVPVAIFSMETGKQQLVERFLCSRSETDSQLVRKGMLDTEHYHELARACDELENGPIYIDDTSSLTPLELRAKARRFKSQYGIRCIIVDYLQLMHLGTSRVESRQQEITTISRYIKALARELNIPVVVISQLNRAPEGREGHRPRMSDLRESGSIEQDADVVMLLHRDDYYHRVKPDYTPNNIADIIIAKQRNGPTGSVKLVFRERFTRFENAAVGPSQQDVPF